MRKKTILASAMTLALLLSACGTAAKSGPTPTGAANDDGFYHKITADEGRSMMDAGDVTVVDVRRADEYEDGHIPGAINIPNEDIGDAEPGALPDKDASIIVYCRTGVRSKQASDKLLALGYTAVYDMGGIADWPYDTVSGTEPGTYVPAEGTPAPGILSSFSTTNLDGNVVDQSILEGYDLTMVNVWATYCGPCLREMPDLGELAEEYSDRGLQIVGLVSDTLNADGTISDSQVDTAREIVEKTGADYLHILPSEDLFGILSQIYGVPTTFFVDSEGRQVDTAYVKSMEKDKWIEIIDDALAEVQK